MMIVLKLCFLYFYGIEGPHFLTLNVFNTKHKPLGIEAVKCCAMAFGGTIRCTIFRTNEIRINMLIL